MLVTNGSTACEANGVQIMQETPDLMSLVPLPKLVNLLLQDHQSSIATIDDTFRSVILYSI